jgi:hypothetical protein
MSKLKLTLASIAAVIAVGATPASAHDARFATSSSFGWSPVSPAAFLGEISSPHGACLPGRLVKVLKQRSGDDRLVGSDRSSSTGQWIVEGNANGRYYATIRSREVGRGGHEHVCRAYRSSTIPFSG